MGRSYIYVNFDARETRVRDGKFWEDRLDPKGMLVCLLIHPKVTKKPGIPQEWLPKVSEDQRRTLGQFRKVPLEVVNTILAYITDYISAACFGATHPRLTIVGLSQWASDRTTLIERYWDNPKLPSHVLTEDEKREAEDLAKDNAQALWGKWPVFETNYAAPNHGDELRARKDNASYSWTNKVKTSMMRWRRAYSEKPMAELKSNDYKRVLKFLQLVEGHPFIGLDGGEYVLCNETKREYVTAEDVTRFIRRSLNGANVNFLGPFINSGGRWGLGDTAGFLTMWDGDNDCGIGVGPWVGDRICITTLKHMRTMKGSDGEDVQPWTHIGGKEGNLWKRVNKVMGDGDEDWLATY